MTNIREKWKSKMLAILTAIVMVLGIMTPVITTVAEAATATIVFQGRIQIPNTSGDGGVGKFLINGKRAFCLEHKKQTPANGSTATEEVYRDPDIQKALYYGWTGPAQWSGFKSEDSGIVFTSILLSQYYSGQPDYIGDWLSMDGANYGDFRNFVESQPAPPSRDVKFNKASATVHWDVKKQKQVTEEVTITGTTGNSLSFTVPEGATLVKNDGTELTGEVTLKVGDKFHFEAEANAVSGTWSSGNVGKTFMYQPILFKTGVTGEQILGQMRLVEDPSAQTSLSVKWLDFGSLELHKIDENSELIDGAKFNLMSFDEATGYGDPGVDYEVKDGRLVIDTLPVGTYTLTELDPPEGHDGIVKTFQIVINKDETTYKAIVNKLNPKGEVIITKTDKDTGEPIEGAEFTIYANDNIYDSITFEKVFDKGDKIATAVTDASGVAKFVDQYMGKYYAKETKEVPGYVPNDTKYEFELRQQDYTTTIYTHEIDVENEMTETAISKVDATTGEEVPGATLQVIDPETDEVVEEWESTTEPHVIKGLIFDKEYILKETLNPRTYELNSQEVKFTVGADTKVEMKDEPIKISGEVDKRQTKIDIKSNTYTYGLDFRSTSSTWADEFNMIDTVDAAIAGYAHVTSVSTPVAFEDWDGKMNVWYKTNKTPSDFAEDAEKYNACSTNPENPWNPDNERVEDFTGWEIWESDLSTLQINKLNVSDLGLASDEYITGIAFEYGRVEKSFATRTSMWDRDNIKSADDTFNSLEAFHVEKFDLSTANGPTKADNSLNYAAAKVEMKVVDPVKSMDAGHEFWNTAKISTYRNLDEHPDLEDHDEDKVVQKYEIGKIVIDDKDKLLDSIVQTGDDTQYMMLAIIGLIAASAAAAAITVNRKKKA